MSPAVRTRNQGPEFADLLPGVVDEDHYARLVPRYSTTSPRIEAAEAEVADMAARVASIDDRRQAAIGAGDSDGLLEALNDEKTLPVALHAARIRLAVAKARHFRDEAARVNRQGPAALAEASHRIMRLQAAVLAEAARIRQACNAATAASDYLAGVAGEAEGEARRLRRFDPTRTPEFFPSGPRIEAPSTSPASSLERFTLNARGDIVGVNGKPLTQADADGNDVIVDGYRVRVDGVLLDDDGEPVKDRGGIVKRVASMVRR